MPSLEKVTEINIFRRLKEEELQEEEHVISDEIFGFRRMLSTKYQVLRITEYMTAAINRKKAIGATMLNVFKLFDKLWHRGLIKMFDSFSLGLVKLIR